ncbi:MULTISPECIES: DUF2933 domain-containing protein [Caballeronia]|uniref:DUF2933 domain-containing protein n=1 Tax=Caballeronia zhejiangensis TaxID=871203 RepID=A0A656QH48_9BURK|nr:MULTISPECIES: DUF2933 domain-containing protein [Caballeronia]KDR28405.1 hypothetical protein BG60_10600 [Caballeronia zhejiangensis]MCE4547758.1 DUF2933 domain-containing protein [Caballeronia sp. PC1]MCE4575688.1 DUF2933 domain-containing protein [Caballeronia sp. CLC5]
MKCNTKTMVTIALALALILAVGYWALPQIRGELGRFIAIASVLICPLSMLFMMRGMQTQTDRPEKSGQATEKSGS